MPLSDERLLDYLACPEDKGPLYYFAAENGLYNPRLRRWYDIRDGIPVMLIDEARSVSAAEHKLLALAAERGLGSPSRRVGRRRRMSSAAAVDPL
jgi:uncharacterized protein YbaR (Trm112 family)